MKQDNPQIDYEYSIAANVVRVLRLRHRWHKRERTLLWKGEMLLSTALKAFSFALCRWRTIPVWCPSHSRPSGLKSVPHSPGDIVLYKATLLISANVHVFSSFHLQMKVEFSLFYFGLLKKMRFYFNTTFLCFFVLIKELKILPDINLHYSPERHAKTADLENGGTDV